MTTTVVQRFVGAARRAADATPDDRDRYLDFLRAISIGVVVIGHWLIAAVWIADGQLQISTALVEVPFTRFITWALQVMPIFFLVGGVVGARSWRTAKREQIPWASWARSRATRLLRPSVVLLWAWAFIATLAIFAGVDPALVKLGSQAALVPLWFLAVYLLIVAGTPLLTAAIERRGLGFPITLTLAAGVVDAAHYSGVAGVGALNFVLVWAACYSLGIAWGDGLLDRIPGWALVFGGIAVLALLVIRAGYPVSMVGVDGAARSNNSPPSLALAVLGWTQAGLALWVAAPARRWLAKPRVWRTVVAVNFAVMTVYLWHLTVMVTMIGLLSAVGVGLDPLPLTPFWWATRPVWIAVLAVVLLPIVAALAPIELSTPKPAAVSGRGASIRVGVALFAAASAVAAIVLFGAAVPIRTVALAGVVHGASIVLGAWGNPLAARSRPVRTMTPAGP